jgi:hypothetical protein
MSPVPERPPGANAADPSAFPRAPVPLPARSAFSGEGVR